MARYSAFIFDMNGTMVDDMHFHEKAWYEIIVNELQAPLTSEQLKLQMYGKNEELFERVFGAGKYTADQVRELSMRKEKQYQADFLPHLKLIDGLEVLLQKAQQENIGLAIGTAAITFNVDYVLDRLGLRHFFPVIIGPEDVKVSKPDPEVFLKAAERLGVDPAACVVFEDAPKGIEAAKRAGMKAVGISSFHTAEELQNDNVLCVVADYNDPALGQLFS
ncbi:MAG: HAD family phosphatase [Chitinophagaceae bacterium]|nr:MAG: HAD family phosphatase [Chitinophagaceae bacterium]